MQNIIETLQENMNPFSESIDKESLFNIGSGKAALTLKYLDKDETMQEDLIAWISMRKLVKKRLVQLSIMFVPYLENQS